MLGFPFSSLLVGADETMIENGIIVVRIVTGRGRGIDRHQRSSRSSWSQAFRSGLYWYGVEDGDEISSCMQWN